MSPRESCDLVIATVPRRLKACFATVASFLSLPFVDQALISVQWGTEGDTFAIPLLRQLTALGGALDSRVRIVACDEKGISQNKHHALTHSEGIWSLLVDDDMIAVPEGMRRLWEAKEGFEGSTGVVYLGGPKTLSHRGRSLPGQGRLDRVGLVRTATLLERGGLMPNLREAPHPPFVGEDRAASSRLALNHVHAVVAVESLSQTTWDPKGGGQGMEWFSKAPPPE